MSEMLEEEAAQMPGGDAKPVCQLVGAIAVQRPLADQAKRAGEYPRGAEPGRRAGSGLGPAPEAWTESSCLGSGSGWKVPDVFVSGRPRGTDRPAIDTGAGDPGEKAAIESGVPRSTRAVAGAVIQIHSDDSLSRRPVGWEPHARKS